MKIAILILMFLFIGGFFIISQNNLSISEKENILEFISLYKTWLLSTAENLGDISGHVIKMEWLPNQTY
jgi:hypothetical protein